MIMNKQDFMTSSGLKVHTLELWLEQKWLIPEQSSAGMAFSDIDVARALMIRDLKDDFGINDEGIDVVLLLLDQVHGLRNVLAQLHKELHGKSVSATTRHAADASGGPAL